MQFAPADANIVFEQQLGDAEFRLRHEFLNAIGIIRQKTLSQEDDKSMLLKLQLEPETQIPNMMAGLERIMSYNSHPGTLLDISILGSLMTIAYKSRTRCAVNVGINVYRKGSAYRAF